MVSIDNILREEIASINRGIIRERKSLEKLLRNPILGGNELDLEKLKYIAEKVSLPLSRVLLPITIFVPARSSEGYVVTEEDARVIEDLGCRVSKRENGYFLAKRSAQQLVRRFPFCFQILYTL